MLQIKLLHRRIRLHPGVFFGFTWFKKGVIGFNYTKRKGAYRENKIIPKLRRPFRLYNRHTHRNYAFQGMYIKIRKSGKMDIAAFRIKCIIIIKLARMHKMLFKTTYT